MIVPQILFEPAKGFGLFYVRDGEKQLLSRYYSRYSQAQNALKLGLWHKPASNGKSADSVLRTASHVA